MDWIKKNYALFGLACCASVLLLVSVLLILNAKSFNQRFEAIQAPVQPNNTIPAVDQTVLAQANESLTAPKVWMPKEGAASPFVSTRFMVQNGSLVPLQGGGMVHPPIPNDWFDQNKLDILDSDVLTQDPDKDGFTNLDEWTGMDALAPGTKTTNPNDPASHPEYITKLKLKKFIKKPFRLLFNAYDGDPSKIDAMSFQINTVDVHQPTQFVKFNETITGTKFKIIKFTPKKSTDANGVDHDISELVLEHNETKDTITLVLEKIVDSPDSYALFKYFWDGTEMVVKKEKTFSLKPEIDVQYKLIDIQESEALIENLKTGTKLKISRATE